MSAFSSGYHVIIITGSDRIEWFIFDFLSQPAHADNFCLARVCDIREEVRRNFVCERCLGIDSINDFDFLLHFVLFIFVVSASNVSRTLSTIPFPKRKCWFQILFVVFLFLHVFEGLPEELANRISYQGGIRLIKIRIVCHLNWHSPRIVKVFSAARIGILSCGIILIARITHAISEYCSLSGRTRGPTMCIAIPKTNIILLLVRVEPLACWNLVDRQQNVWKPSTEAQPNEWPTTNTYGCHWRCEECHLSGMQYYDVYNVLRPSRIVLERQ